MQGWNFARGYACLWKHMAAPPQAPDFVQLFVAVGDVKSSVAHAVPPTLLPEGDEMVVMHDPSGMSFAVWRRD